MSLFTVLSVFAGNDKRSELIKPDAKGRVIVTPEMISGVQAVKDRMNAPVKENALDARIKSEKMEFQMLNHKVDSEARQAAENQKRQRTSEAIEKSQVEQQSRRAPAGAAPSSSFGNQWSQPYQAFGQDSMLSHVDLYYSLRSGAFKKFGQQVYTYDADGYATVTEYTVQNVDGIANQLGSWGVKIPTDATIKEVIVNSDTLNESSVYYIDPATGQQHYIEQSRSVYYNGETVSMIRKRVDASGNMVEYGKIESEFDAQGRPVQTIRYSQYTIVDPATGNTSWELRPYRKLEYEYLSDSLITTTESYTKTDASGKTYWAYNNRITRGKDSNGATYYEYMYVRNDTVWVGSYKYTQLEKAVADGSELTDTRWSWNSTLNAWYLSGKTYYRYNSRNNTILQESYSYSTPLQAFYLTNKRGYEYLGDTLRCGEWTIYYNSPDSLAQLADPNALAYSGYKNEYRDYTQQELGWSSSVLENISLPRKYDIHYNMDTSNKKETIWIPTSKNEYEYVLATRIGSRYPESFVSDQKYFSWYNGAWEEDSETKYGYNEYGDQILYESYENGQITSRQTSEYEYKLVYSDGDSVYNRNTLSEKYWRVVNGTFMPSYDHEYGYDDDNRQNMETYYSGWDTLSNKWLYGSKTEYSFDENGNRNGYASYDWKSALNAWIGNYKEFEVYSKWGETLKREVWFNRSDSTTVWIPNSIEETKIDEAGNILSNEYYSCWNGESWDYGNKIEWTYSAEGLLLSECSISINGGQQYGEYKREYEYNAAGQMTQHMEYRYDSYDSMDWVPSEKEVFTYTADNALLNRYRYSYSDYDSEWQLNEKQLAVVEDGRIVAYVDSVYSSWDDSWTPSSMTAVTYDDANGMVTTMTSYWDSNNELWQNSEKASMMYDSKGRLIYTESYNWAYDYNSSGYYWRGNEKAEYGYNDEGEQVMVASYYWNSYDTVWVGDYKYEQAYDKEGRQILYGSYSWVYDRQDWRGNYRDVYAYDNNGHQILSESYNWDEERWTWVGNSKTEYVFDAYGNNISSTYYNTTDTLGNWIGSEKYSYYTKDGITYNERYYWDNEKKDWRGDYKSEYCYGDGYYMSTSYDWDDADWCWVGSYKDEQTYTDNSMESTSYIWDRSANDWLKDRKEKKEIVETASSFKSILTVSTWNVYDSKWDYYTRETNEDVYNANGNQDYQLVIMESYNPLTSNWYQAFAIRMVYVYKSLTGVEDIHVDMNIRVEDGLIIVTAADDTAIRISAASGAQVASGKGSVEAPVASGIYLISVGNKTVKVVVR